MFVIDNSESIRACDLPGANSWQVMLDFVKSIIEAFSIGLDATRIAVVDFGMANFPFKPALSSLRGTHIIIEVCMKTNELLETTRQNLVVYHLLAPSKRNKPFGVCVFWTQKVEYMVCEQKLFCCY